MSEPNRLTCPVCDAETEFVQFEKAARATTEITQAELGNGLLELRSCKECGHGIENVLTADKQAVVTEPEQEDE